MDHDGTTPFASQPVEPTVWPLHRDHVDVQARQTAGATLAVFKQRSPLYNHNARQIKPIAAINTVICRTAVALRTLHEACTTKLYTMNAVNLCENIHLLKKKKSSMLAIWANFTALSTIKWRVKAELEPCVTTTTSLSSTTSRRQTCRVISLRLSAQTMMAIILPLIERCPIMFV